MFSGKKIGVLAMQGAFQKHCLVIERLGAGSVEVRTEEDLNNIDGLIIPGGESTVISKLLTRNGLFEPIKGKALKGMPVFGTCAGMIMLSKDAEDFNLPLLGLMDISVRRNAYGRQLESFEASFNVREMNDGPFDGIFIRAPQITAYGKGVEVLAEFEGVPILVRENRFIASSFHPELTGDLRIHRLFLSMIS